MSNAFSASERWRRVIQQQQGSGLSVVGFCRREGVPESSFFAWKRRLRRQAQLPTSLIRTPTPFVQVTTAASPEPQARHDAADAIEICLRGQRRLRVRAGFDRSTLAEVVRTLEALA